jgi:hypothetical protein
MPNYRRKPTGSSGCICNIDPSIQTTLLHFADFIAALRESVDKYFPVATIGVELKGLITTRGSVSSMIFVRFYWKDNFPTIPQDRTSVFYRTTIRDYYYALGLGDDWALDPLSKITT